jgi:hypothetical protein
MSTIPAKEIERNRREPDGPDFVRARSNHALHKTHRRQTCAIIFNVPSTVLPSVARSAKESSAWSDTTPGEQPSAQRNALTDSKLVERTTAGFYLASKLPDSGSGENCAAILQPSSFRSREVSK